MSFKKLIQVILAAALVCGFAFGQSEFGAMTGTVTDSSNAAVPGAQVEAKDLRTGAVRQTVSGTEGIFVFNSLNPDRYTITVKATGFKTYTQNDIDITANAPRDLGAIVLSLGALTEEVSVTAAATPVQTASSENSKLVDTSQMEQLSLKGRDMFAILQTIPGVSMGNTYLTGGDATSETAGLGALNINGTGNERANFTVDGVTDIDTGNNGQTDFEPTMDTIAEIRVLTSNYQAEFGRTSGGTITVVTKGGSQEFHGTAYVNKRHEMFNATNYLAETANHTPKSIYRFFVYGFSIGGPVYIPKHFNTQKKRLFFFFSQEYTKQKPASYNNTASVPTSNVNYLTGATITGMSKGMVQGDFFDRCAAAAAAPCTPGYYNGSGVNQNSSLVNPANNKAPLANGDVTSLIGTSYYDAASAAYGQKIMAFLPTPNMCTAAAGIYNGAAISPTNCPAGFTTTGISTTNNYSANFFYQFNETHPRTNNTARVDYNVTSKLSTWFRYSRDYDQDDASPTLPAKSAAGTWDVQSSYHPFPGHGYAAGATYTISPTMVNEFTWGRSWSSWSYYPHDQSQLDRSNMGNPPSFDNFTTDPLFTADVNKPRPTLSPGSENYQIGIPTATFGSSNGPSEANAAGPGCGLAGQCPITTFTWTNSINDNLSKVVGKHNLKAGIFWEHAYKSQANTQGSQLGTYAFGTGGVLMASDTQDGYANAWLGNMNNYSEGQRVVGNFYYTNVEAFVQDNWRVNRRLTLDLGVRIAHMSPITDVTANQTAEFMPSAYAGTTPERIYYPACMTPGTTTVVSTANGTCPTADQTAWDPVTQTKQFYSFQGALVPAAVGGYSGTPNPFPGMVVAGTGALPINLYHVPVMSPQPRIGFAWDVFGNGKTAVRGGAGIFLNRSDFNLTFLATSQQPTAVNRSVYYTNITSILSPTVQNTAAIQPIAPGTDLIGNQHIESTYNGNLQVQQNLGFSTVLEVGYVFALRRHLPFQQAINYTPLYSQYNPAWQSSMAQYLANPLKNGGLTQGNASGLDYSNNYFYNSTLCTGCVAGLAGLNREGFGESTDYHSLQITLRRNMTKHLSYGLAYTFNKLMGLGVGSIGNGSNGVTESAIFTDKFRNWGPQYNPAPQVVEINYVYEVPNLGQKLNFKPLGWVTDHWTWSGLTQIRSDVMVGIPGVTLSNTNGTSNPGENWTGSSNEGNRAIVVGNYRLSSIGQSPQYNGLGKAAVASGPGTNGASAPLPAGLQEDAPGGTVAAGYTTAQYAVNGSAGNQVINEAFIQQPFPCSATAASNPVYGIGQSMACLGNAGSGSLLNLPGTRIFNFDMTFSKNFPLKSEKRVLIFRAEMYNIFNHPQFTSANTGPSYDWNNWKNGVLVETANNVGRYTGVVNPRQMSMSLRLQF